MGVEEEIKLIAPNLAALDALLQDPLVLAAAGGDVVDHSFIAIYYDTVGYPLLNNRLAFRLRQRGQKIVASLKGGGAMAEGLSRRLEWEEPISSYPTEFHQLPDGVIRRTIDPFLPPEAPLLRLLETQVERRALHLIVGVDTRIELALDYGLVLAGNGSDAICEAELELLAGPLAPMQAFAAQLCTRHALAPAQGSKFTQGLRLLGRNFAELQF